MYKNVGETFAITWYGKIVHLSIHPQAGCAGCFFYQARTNSCKGYGTVVPIKTGNCYADARGDKQSVIFKELKSAATT